MWWVWVYLSLAWAGPAPELHEVLQQTASWRALRSVKGTPTITPAEYARVANGEVIGGLRTAEGAAAKRSFGVAVVDVPIERMWAAVNDESLHPEYTNLDYAELVQGAPCESGRHVFHYKAVNMPMVSDRWWVTIREMNTALSGASNGRVRELSWRGAPDGSEVTSATAKAYMAKGIMVTYTRGSWLLTRVNERQTLVEYSSWVDPGGKMAPSLISMFATRTMIKTIDDMTRVSRDPRLKCLP